jgi:hypothetical protein
MKNRCAVIELATRVLTAIAENRRSNPEDIRELRRLALLDAGVMPDEELACLVIHKAIQPLSKVRVSGQR